MPLLFARVRAATAVAGVFLLLATHAHAQYFGQNKVQYDDFDFEVLQTEHFDIYYYPEEEAAVRQAARMAERWYARLSRLLQHRFADRQPLILYGDHPDFEQTNTVGGLLSESTGGVTESLKRRIVLPFAAGMAETDHVLGHELVHAFQYDIAARLGEGAGASNLPLWFVEGMAEYLSVGPVDPHTAMWIREAAANDELPDIDDLYNPRYFPYRYGQALWAYIGGVWGDEVIGDILKAAGGDPIGAIERATELDAETLSERWHEAIAETYRGIIAAKPVPAEVAHPLVTEAGQGGTVNVGPALSPDGSRLVFLSERDLFSINLYLADARTGDVIREIVETAVDPHFDSLQFINSAGSWSPDGRGFVFSAIRQAKPVLVFLDVERGEIDREIRFEELGEIFNASWSPDGRRVAFSSLTGGITDLYVYDLESEELARLTDDIFADLQPAWAPDGRQLAFVTDRFSSNAASLAFGQYELAVMDVTTRRVRRLPGLEGGKHITPQWTPDGRGVYFISDRTGISNVYRLDLDEGSISQITDIQSGVSGITKLSPALSTAADSGRLAFSAYTNGNYEIFTIDTPDALRGNGLASDVARAGMLPPEDRRPSAVVALLRQPAVGLPADAVRNVKDYSPGLQLDFVGQPSIIAGSDAFGSYLGGGISAYFSDMLGNHNLSTFAQIQGDFDNFAAQVGYLNLDSRWNWGGAAGWIPYTTGSFAERLGTLPGGEQVVVQEARIFRQKHRTVGGVVAYPFSRAQRVELSGGFRSVDFQREVESRVFLARTGELIAEEQQDLPAEETLNLGEASLALVYDTSIFGPTSPILGRRYRLEVSPTVGNLTYARLLADYRHYVMPVRPLTIAGRVLHVSRLGGDAEDQRLTPLFIGYSELVRGYEFGSFSLADCGAAGRGGCPALDALIGSRIAVANLEMRFPLAGVFSGDLNYGPLPVEGLVFADAGVAWTRDDAPRFAGGTRQIVKSVGAGVRVNAFGFAILEFDAIRPLDRPNEGWMFGFSFRPGF